MRFYIIIFIFLSLEYAYHNASSTHQNIDGNSGCLTDELYGDFTDEEYNNLVKRRKNVRQSMNKNLSREELDTLYVPVVFHNLYKLVTGEPVSSYCDYESGSTTIDTSVAFYQYTTGNNQERCETRMLRSLKVLNANYATAGIQFVLHPDYLNMQHATDPEFDGFYERATDGTADFPNANDLKEHYNIPNALNIYIVDFIYTRDGTSGISTYPKDITASSSTNIPGAFFKHGFLPGDVDGHASAEYDRTLMHEIGHFFGLLHINGIWFAKKGNKPRDLVIGTDCNEHGDTICDTPAEPGGSVNAWYTNSSTHECIFHGYYGEYSSSDDTLKIGGYNSDGGLVYGWNGLYGEDYEIYNYNYCEEWEIEDPYDLNDHCYTYTNYDNVGDFFGTKDLPENCFSQNQSEYATECHIDNYTYYDINGRLITSLPIGHNFMRAASFPYNDCGISPINDNIYYDETKQGFTEEQFANIKNSLELDYTQCTEQGACNEGASIHPGINTDYLLRSDTTSCYYGSNISPNANDCFVKGECVYGCEVEMAAINENVIPQNFGINQIYPNPFNPITTIRYGLAQNSDVQISIYDINGRLITTLINEFQITGYHFITWDASNYSSGIYFLNMSADEIAETKKMLLIK